MKIEIEGKPQHIIDADLIKLATFSLKIFIRTIKREKEIRPTFHLYNGSRRYIYMTSWSNHDEKRIFQNFLHEQCIKYSAHYVIAVSDIWISNRIEKLEQNQDLKKLLDRHRNFSPSADPQRKEALICIIFFPDGKADYILAPYNRSPNGFPIFQENPRWLETDGSIFRLIRPWVKNYV